MPPPLILQKEKIMKKSILFTLLFLFTVMASTAQQRAMVLEIDEEIDATAWRNTSRAIGEARAAIPPIDVLDRKSVV